MSAVPYVDHPELEEALLCHRQGEVDKASNLYLQVLSKDANHAISQHHLSVLKYGQGDYEAALVLQNQLLQQHPHQAGYFNNRGNTLVRLGYTDQALQDFNQAIHLQASVAEFRVNRANALVSLDRMELALDDLNQALQLAPNLAMACANRANVFHLTDRQQEALADIEHALQLEPDNASFHFNKANILVSLQRYAQAAVHYQQACDIDPTFEMAHLKWVYLLMRMQALPQAAQVLQSSLQQQASVACWVLLGEVHALLGETALAQHCFAQAKTFSPQDEEVDFYAAANLGMPPPMQAPAAYVTRLFDRYAPHFEWQVLNELNYASPAHLHTQWLRHVQAPPAHALDLGCGTGLVAKAFKHNCGVIDGVDISSHMLNKAQATGLYRQLHEQDLHLFLQQVRQRYDLVVCADTLVYIGDLAAVFEGVGQALKPGGWFSFTIEATSSPRYALKQSKRYGHSIPYIEQLAQAQGLQMVAIETDIIRQEQPVPVRGFNLLLQKI